GLLFSGKGLIEWALATPVVFVAGYQFFRNALKNARYGAANMDTLIALGSFSAYAYSVAALLRGSPHEHAHTYFETAALIVTLILLGRFLEARAKGRAKAAIQSLLKLRPKTARQILPSGEERDVPIEVVKQGDRLLVRPGEQIPVDGVIRDGQSSVDE